MPSSIKDANVNTNQIDFCAITSTQGVELIVDDPKEISISLADPMRDTSHRTTMNKPELTFRVLPSLFSEIGQNRSAINSRKMYSSYFPEYKKYEKREGQFSGWLDKYVTDAAWLPPKSLQQ